MAVLCSLILGLMQQSIIVLDYFGLNKTSVILRHFYMSGFYLKGKLGQTQVLTPATTRCDDSVWQWFLLANFKRSSAASCVPLTLPCHRW